VVIPSLAVGPRLVAIPDLRSKANLLRAATIDVGGPSTNSHDVGPHDVARLAAGGRETPFINVDVQSRPKRSDGTAALYEVRRLRRRGPRGRCLIHSVGAGRRWQADRGKACSSKCAQDHKLRHARMLSGAALAVQEFPRNLRSCGCQTTTKPHDPSSGGSAEHYAADR
jgi:hypothetical protein